VSALGYASASVAGVILLVGVFLDEHEPGAMGAMYIIAVFPMVVCLIDWADHIMERTLDKWLARKHNKNFEEAA